MTREGADQRQRHRDARDDGRREAAQEEEDDQHDQDDGQDQLELHVGDRGADGGRAVGDDRHLASTAGREACSCGSSLLDAVDQADDVGAGLALDVQDDRRGGVDPGGLLDVLGAVDDRGHVGERARGAVAVGDDDRARSRAAGEELVVGADGPGLPGAVEVALGLVHVGLRRAPCAGPPGSCRRRPGPWGWPGRAPPGAGRR